MTQAGGLLDREPIVIREGGGLSDVAITADRNGFAVAWGEKSEIYSATLSFSGTVSSPIRLSSEATLNMQSAEPSIASSGEGFLLAWTRVMVTYDTSIYVGRAVERILLDTRGKPIEGTHRVLPEYRHTPRVASSGEDYLLVSAMRADALLISRTDGSELARLEIHPANGSQLLPFGFGPPYAGIAWDGTAYRIASFSGSSVKISILRRDGTLALKAIDAPFHPSAGQDLAVNAAGVSVVLAVETRSDLSVSNRIVAYTDSDFHGATIRRRSARR